MSIPNLPPFYNMKWVNEDFNLTVDASLYSDELSQTLIRAVILLNNIANSSVVTTSGGTTNAGTINYDSLNAPQKTTTQINAFATDTSVPNGAIWFDTDVSKLKVKTAASTVETVSSS